MKNMFKSLTKHRLFLLLSLFGSLFILFNETNYSYSSTQTIQSYWRHDDSLDMEIFDRFAFALEPGMYSIKFFYDPSTIKETIEYQLVDFDQISPTNDGGVIVESGLFEPGSDSTYLEFSLEKASTELRFAFSQQFSFYSYTLTSLSDRFTDVWIILITWIVLAYLLDNWYKKRRFDFFILLVVVFVLSIPVFGKCLYTGPDLDFHLSRVKGIADGLSSLQIPVRINYNFFYNIGNADPIFYPNLWLYIPALLKCCGASLVFSYQYFIFLINGATAALTYFAFKRWSNHCTLALFLSILYLCNPFRINDIYIRCALGESLALTFLPLFFVSLCSIVFDGKKDWKWLAFSAFGILHSHLLSVGMTTVLSALVLLFNLPKAIKERRFEFIFPIFKAILVVLMSSLWYVVPLMDKMRMNLSILSSNNISNSALNIVEMFSFDNYFNSSTTMGVNMGILTIVTFVLSVLVFKRCTYQNRRKINCFVAIIGLCIYFASNYFPWSWIAINYETVLNAFNNLQFAWRIHSYTVVFCLMLFSVVFIESKTLFHHLKAKQNSIVAILLSFTVADCYICLNEVISNRIIELSGRSESVKYSTLLYYDYYDSGFGSISFESIRDQQNKILSKFPIEISDSHVAGATWEFELLTNHDNHITVPWYDYGFYHVYVNDIEVATTNDEYFIGFDIAEGNHKIVVCYEERKLYFLADAVSALWIFCCICVYFRRRMVRLDKGL